MRCREVVERRGVAVVVALGRIGNSRRDRRIAYAGVGRAGDQRRVDRFAGRKERPECGRNAQDDHVIGADTGPCGKGPDVQIHRHPVLHESQSAAQFGPVIDMKLQVAVKRIECLADANVGQAVEDIGWVRRGNRAGQGIGRAEGTGQKGRSPEIDAGTAGVLRIPADVIIDRRAADAVPRQAQLVHPVLGQPGILRRGVRLEAGQHVQRVRGGETGKLPVELASEVIAQLLAENFPAGIDGQQVGVLGVDARRILNRSALFQGQCRAVEIGRNGTKRAKEGRRRCWCTRAARPDHLGITEQVRLAPLIHCLDRQRVGRLEQNRGAERPILDTGLDRSAHAVNPVAFAVLDIGGQADRQHILDNRQVDCRLHVPVIGRTIETLDETTKFREVRLFGYDRDCAGNRRRAARCALRPAQHFDLADVKKRHDSLARIEADFVEIDRGCRRARTRTPGNTAQRHLGAGTGIDQGQARRELGKLVRRSDRQLLQRIAGHHLHRDRHVLQPLVRAPRGDDDVIFGAGLCPIGLRALRESGEGRGQCRGCRQHLDKFPGHVRCSVHGPFRPNGLWVPSLNCLVRPALAALIRRHFRGLRQCN